MNPTSPYTPTDTLNLTFAENPLTQHNFTISCGPVTLRPPTIEDIFQLAKIVHKGLFENGASTLGEWYDPDDPVGNARKVLSYQFLCWAPATGTGLPKMPFTILTQSKPIGIQSYEDTTNNYLITKELGTGSWIDPQQRGKHYGTHARWALLHFAFEQLEAQTMVSSALVDNPASNKVSLNCGYDSDGYETREQNGKRILLQRYRLEKTKWENNPDRPAVTVANFEQAQKLILKN